MTAIKKLLKSITLVFFGILTLIAFQIFNIDPGFPFQNSIESYLYLGFTADTKVTLLWASLVNATAFAGIALTIAYFLKTPSMPRTQAALYYLLIAGSIFGFALATFNFYTKNNENKDASFVFLMSMPLYCTQDDTSTSKDECERHRKEQFTKYINNRNDENHVAIAGHFFEIANNSISMKDDIKTESLFSKAISIMEKAVGPDSPLLGYRFFEMGKYYHYHRNNSEKSKFYIERALPLIEKSLGAGNPSITEGLDILAKNYESTNHTKAAQLLDRSISIKEGLLGKEDPSLINNLASLTYLREKDNDATKAKASLDRILLIIEKNPSVNFMSHMEYNELLMLLDFYVHDKRVSEAAALNALIASK